MDCLRIGHYYRVNIIIYRFQDRSLRLRQTHDGARQAVCGACADTQIRWPQTSLHDSALSVTVLIL
jgi:hypothetical protein